MEHRSPGPDGPPPGELFALAPPRLAPHQLLSDADIASLGAVLRHSAVATAAELESHKLAVQAVRERCALAGMLHRGLAREVLDLLADLPGAPA